MTRSKLCPAWYKRSTRIAIALTMSSVFAALLAATTLGGPTRVSGAFPGRNGKIAFEATGSPVLNSEVFAMNPDGSGVVDLTKSPLSDGAPEWSPNGKRIVFMRREPSGFDFNIFVMNADGSGQTQLTFSPALDEFPTWSPDGTKIAFVSTRSDPNPTSPDATQQIWVMNSDGSSPRQLTFRRESSALPAWSSSGLIAFARSTSGSASLWVMNGNGSDQRFLLANGIYAKWSPDGHTIIFNRERVDSTIWVIHPDGTGLRQLTPSGEFALYPAWSPNGEKVVFEGTRGLWLMNSDGSARTRIPTPSGGDGFPDWQQSP
jgi:Tol biopolymer transport system component